jgi:hypothetical protein
MNRAYERYNLVVESSLQRAFRDFMLLCTLTTAVVLTGSVLNMEPINALLVDSSADDFDPDKSDPAVAFALKLTETRSQWLADFVASGRDPRELPLENMEVDHWGPPMTLARAQREARFVVQGRVLSTTYVSDARSLGFPRSIATIQIDRLVKGRISSRMIEVLQPGGPEWDPQGGKLWQLAGDPLLFPGNEVILLLVPAYSEEQRRAGRFQTLYEAGIYLITDQGVFASGRNALAGLVSGHSVDRVLELFD